MDFGPVGLRAKPDEKTPVIQEPVERADAVSLWTALAVSTHERATARAAK